MSARNDGGPAFPMQEQQAIHAVAIAAVVDITDSAEREKAYLKARGEAVGGMSLRDYFAAHAPEPPEHWHGGERKTSDIIEWRWAYADSMLKAREA